MVVDIPKHLLGRNDEVHHFPYGLNIEMIRARVLVVSIVQLTVSKSIEVNLKSRRKNGGTRRFVRRWEDMVIERFNRGRETL